MSFGDAARDLTRASLREDKPSQKELEEFRKEHERFEGMLNGTIEPDESFKRAKDAVDDECRLVSAGTALYAAQAGIVGDVVPRRTWTWRQFGMLFIPWLS